MKTTLLGSTGINVSALCLGAMFFGTRNNKTTSYRLLDQYIDAGGTFIDTANIYAHWVSGGTAGASEKLLGEWLRERGSRDRLFIASKVGFDYPGLERGLSARQIEEECNKSLQYMGIETIDLYYAHVDDRNTPLEETMQAFDRLIQAGKVRYLGASNFPAWRIAEAQAVSVANSWAQYVCVQQRHTYLRPRPGTTFSPQVAANDDLLDYCQERGLTLLPYSVLLGGAYSRADRPIPDQYAGPDSDARMAALKAVSEETGATMNQLVLDWMLHSDLPTIPLIAASTEEHLQENLDALNITLTAEQMRRLDTAGI